MIKLPIESASQRGKQVYVYGPKGKLLFTKLGKLQTVTSLNVSIKLRNTLLIYDNRGKLQFSKQI